MLDDREILTAYREEGKEDYAFNLIVRKYSERVYWHIRKMVNDHEETNDLLQNTFVKVWKYLPDFREESNLYTWIYKIATNETLNFLRKEKLKSLVTFSDYSQIASEKIDEDPYFNGNEMQRRLYKAIRSLPPKQKAVFSMRYFEELKYEEMAEILGGTVGSLKASYHHAYTKVLKFLEEKD